LFYWLLNFLLISSQEISLITLIYTKRQKLALN
jgi:hypothetical protein